MSYRFSHCEMGFVVQAERRKSTLPIETFIHEDYTCSVYETDAAFFLYHPLYPFSSDCAHLLKYSDSV